MTPRRSVRACLVMTALVFLGAGPVRAQDNLKYGQPACPGKVLDKKFFVICYNPQWKVPAWVGYELRASDLNGPAKRRNNFRPDTSIPVNERSQLADYARSGYDRGHMAPAEDFTRSTTAMSTTFLLTNMAPQRPKMNEQRWKQLETAVRKLAKTDGTVWIFTGAILIGNRPIAKIGQDKVFVPTHFYKVILGVRSDSTKEMFAFVMPNIDVLQKGLARYVSSVDSVEKLTGFDFFSLLPKAEQAKLEAEANNLP